MQRIDDPARNLRKVWLGAEGVGRFPVTARFAAWLLWLGLSIVLIPVFALAVPFVVVIVGVVYGLARAAQLAKLPSFLGWFTGGLVGLLLAVAAVGLDGIAGLLTAPYWLLSPVIAIPVALTITARIMPHVTPNTPIQYLARHFYGRASAPRRRRDPLTYDLRDTYQES